MYTGGKPALEMWKESQLQSEVDWKGWTFGDSILPSGP